MRYEDYKKVDLPWVKKVPSRWELKRAKNLYKKENRPTREDDEVITCFRDGQVTLRKNRRTTGFTESILEHGYQGVRKGDLVIHVMDAFAGAIGVSDSDGKSTPVYNVCTSIIELDNRYYAYLLRSLANIGYIQSLYRGIRERSTDFRFDIFQKMNLLVPPKEEQEQIARFLDWKINEIDSLIEMKKKKIYILLKLKDRYLNYYFGNLIEINSENFSEKHIKIKYLTKTITSNSYESKHFIGLENIESNTGRILSKIEDLPVKNDGIDVNKNMIIFGKLRPYLAKVYQVEKESKCSSEFLVLECLNDLNSEFMKFLMLSPTFIRLVNESTYGAKMPRANTDFIKSIKIKKVLLQEQTKLANETKNFFEKYDLHIKNIKSQISKLEQLKQSLISDVVTGKIDVRNVDIPDYDKVGDVVEEAILEDDFNKEE